jgi:PHD/YefM family antitoxin component YafN of YafNO toxin-antitoxin module
MSTVTVTELKEEFRKTTGRVELAGERVIVLRNSREAFALIPIDDLRLLEMIEDKMDALEALKSLEDPRPSIPWEVAKQTLR